MIDYYSMLGLSSAASQDAIRERLMKVSSPNDREAIEHILLNPSRRKVYDKNWVTLKRIGRLRANMRMGNTEHWSGLKNKDFFAAKDDYPPLLDQLKSTMDAYVRSKGANANTAVPKVPIFQKVAFTLFALVFAGVILSTIFDKPAKKRSTTSSPSNSQTFSPPTTKPAFDQPVKPLPSTGVISQVSGEAPFQIKTGIGGNYYIKLCRSNGTCVLVGFIRGGSTLKTTVPLGTYELRYAVGDQWYGTEHLFGPSTSYHKAGKSFTFSLVGNQYSGYTVELIKQVGGNLRTHTMSKNNF